MWTWTSSTVATLTTLATLATALAAMATRLTITVWRIHTQAHSERTAAAARLSLKLTVYLTDYARNSPGRGHLNLERPPVDEQPFEMQRDANKKMNGWNDDANEEQISRVAAVIERPERIQSRAGITDNSRG